MPPKGATSVEMRPVLRPTMPYSSASVTRHERARSRVYRYAASPNSVSFARRMASSSLSTRNSGATGPKVSSRASIMLLDTLVSTVGS